ncbi:MAG TPA: 50S ribosomal protein L3 [Candidatus Thermoplasmatota archaeon]|nr:50S ribosomal protein L3 [Candidatus Thermoplasmatota archaeon]
MGQPHRSKKGSKGFSPRKRALSQVPRLTSWPLGGDAPKIQGFAGYKAGMTHAVVVDYRPDSLTSGQEVTVPVTVVEVPAMRVAAVRYYRETPYGLKTLGEQWAAGTDARLKLRLPVPKEPKAFTPEAGKVDDVRLLAYTQPKLVSGIPRKTPEIMELRVGGGDLAARIAFAQDKLGKEITVADFAKPGEMIDVAAVTKGHGVKGAVPRWGVKLQGHKDSKNRRDASPLGPFQPRFIRSMTVPMPGQMGYHNRTEYNKRILKIGTEGAEITPAGGFLHYGVVRNQYILLHGSIPGPAKRLIRLRDATRYLRGIEVAEPQLAYVSTASKQGR